VAVAQAALTFSQGVFARAWAYCDGKQCYSPQAARAAALSGAAPDWPALGGFSHLSALFAEARLRFGALQAPVHNLFRSMLLDVSVQF
jgi:hypothetical protein